MYEYKQSRARDKLSIRDSLSGLPRHAPTRQILATMRHATAILAAHFCRSPLPGYDITVSILTLVAKITEENDNGTKMLDFDYVVQLNNYLYENKLNKRTLSKKVHYVICNNKIRIP